MPFWRRFPNGRGKPHDCERTTGLGRFQPSSISVDMACGERWCADRLGPRLPSACFIRRVGGLAHAGRARSLLGEAIAFFAYDTPKVLLLLTLVVFGMGMVRSFFSPSEPAPCWQEGAKLSATSPPLPSASSHRSVRAPRCPWFIGFVSAGDTALEFTFSFLVAAPMGERGAGGFLFGLVGWQVALTYLAFGLVVVDRLRLGDRPAASGRLA